MERYSPHTTGELGFRSAQLQVELGPGVAEEAT
jgi:hypothetical protein